MATGSSGQGRSRPRHPPTTTPPSRRDAGRRRGIGRTACAGLRADFDARSRAARAVRRPRRHRFIHYWYENDLVDRRWAALNDGDIAPSPLPAPRAPSTMCHRNVTAELGKSQPAMRPRRRHLERSRRPPHPRRWLWRHHPAFVPVDMVDDHGGMDAWLGEALPPLRHLESGAYAGWL
ncbi:MAG: hypothetical protein ACLTKG_05525 [Collinsella intestinalis]